MLRPSSSLADALARRLRALESVRAKIEELVSSRVLSEKAAEHVYEGLFLNAHVPFEGFLEDLFIGLLVDGQGVLSSRSDIKPRVAIRLHRIARQLLSGPQRRYVAWFPYERTIEMASLYFQGGRPFTELSEAQRQQLRKSHIIRNAIAHRSRFSMHQFEKQVIGNTPLPPRERTPAGFLRGQFRITPKQTRYENLVSQLLLIARDLAK